MNMQLQKVGNLLDEKEIEKGFISLDDIPKIKNRQINYQGPGFYSLDDMDNIYQIGIFPTYSRIKCK